MSPLGLEPEAKGLATGSPDRARRGTGKSTPPGVDGIIEFGGIFLNIRKNIDTYMVNEIGGLDDADLRDDREANPQAHGETAFDAFYGGRTITLSGYVRAFRLDKLRDMISGLKQAMSNLEGEMPLIFHNYNDPEWDVQIMVRKGAPLQLREVQTDHNYFRRDFLITFRASNPRFMGMVDQFVTASFAYYEDFSGNLNNYDRFGSLAVITSNQLTPVDTNVHRLVRKADTGFIVDSDVEVVYKYTPNTSTMTGSAIRGIVKYLDDNNYIFGEMMDTGQIRFRKVDAGTTSVLSNGTTAPARSATNYWLRVRTVGNVLTAEHFNVDPRANLSAVPGATVTHTLTGSDLIKFGFGIKGRVGLGFQPANTSWRVDDLTMGTYNALAASIMTVDNKGDFPAQPEITFFNKMTAITMINTLNGDQVSLESDLAALDQRTINIAQSTLKDQNGVGKFNELGITSDWLELAPGTNPIKMTATGMSVVYDGTTYQIPGVSLKYKHTWF